MKTKLNTLLIFFALSCITAFAQEKQLFNVLSLPNGAYIVRAPNSYASVPESSNDIVKWTQEAIIDGTSVKGWSSEEGVVFPMEFVFELSEECLIEKFGFNTECEKKYPGICAKKLKVEVSTTNADEGYATVLEPKLTEFTPTNYFDIKPIKARWIKVTILSNYGFKPYTELMEIEALGSYVKDDIKSINLTGDWTSTWGTVSIRQKGSSIKGCYKYRNGIITNAGIDRRILNFKWVEEGEHNIGQAVLVVNEEGTRLNGIWGFGDKLDRYGIWTFKKKGNTPTRCYQVEEVEKIDTVKQNRLKDEIESTGKLTIYGINFETASANIKPESYPTLDEIYNMLNETATMKLKINGHTDSQGSAEFNKKLSTNRAESVKAYLVSKGIAADRLEAYGQGKDFPIADNATQLGRAANRRVELILNQAK